jgi:prepilin signal peptidase PulO-like enzyme (type II secretory pathway)
VPLIIGLSRLYNFFRLGGRQLTCCAILPARVIVVVVIIVVVFVIILIHFEGLCNSGWPPALYAD